MKKKALRLPVPATGHYSTARHNLEGAKRIAHTIESVEELDTNLCVQFLLGWVAEGFLKTFLAGTMDDRQLANCIGHDLNEAWRSAKEAGLQVGGTGSLEFVISTLADAHLNMFWRYLPTNQDGTERVFDMVMPSLAFPALDALDAAVWPCVEADMNRLLKKQGRPFVVRWSAVLSALP